MVVRGQVVGRGHHGVRAEVVELPVELRGVDVELYVDIDGDQPRDLREYPVVEGRDVEHVVVILEPDAERCLAVADEVDV